MEQNNPDKLYVLLQIASSNYAYLWEPAFGVPLSYSTEEEINANYDRVGLAIAAYEGSTEVNSFTSKYDYFLKGMAELTELELWGLDLFNDEEKGKCALCHISEVGEDGEPPLFTDFTFDNLGVPKNPKNPFYSMDEVYLPDGSPINPLGDAWIDYGLGGYLATLEDVNPEWYALADENMGKHKVPTLRNVDLRPGNGFTKAYMHNGALKSLKEVVHFYNTRDVEDWPLPEVMDNMNTEELGDLGLTNAEEDAIVAFMKTLSDGYKLPKTMPLGETTPEISLRVMNPVTYNTSVWFSLPYASSVRIEIYSITGVRVATLAQGSYSQGDHQVILSPENFIPGLYIIHMVASGHDIARKINILR